MACASGGDELVMPITPSISNGGKSRAGLKSRAKFSIRIVDGAFGKGSAKTPLLDPAIEPLENLS